MTQKDKKETSEFGKGLTYCLGLFLCHSERDYWVMGNKDADSIARAEMWFNAASDHLYDLEIPKTLPKKLQKRLSHLKERAIHWGHGFQNDCKEEDKLWAIQEAKDLLKEIDKHFGVNVTKGDWE